MFTNAYMLNFTWKNTLDPRRFSELRFGESMEDLDDDRKRGMAIDFSDTIAEVLTLNWINFNSSEFRGVDLGTWNWIVLDALISKGIDMFGVDARPRAINKDLNIYKARIEELDFIDSNSIDLITSVNLFDVCIYKQNRKRMLGEISRILSPSWIYFWIEHQENLPLLPGMDKLMILKRTLKSEHFIMQTYRNEDRSSLMLPVDENYKKLEDYQEPYVSSFLHKAHKIVLMTFLDVYANLKKS